MKTTKEYFEVTYTWQSGERCMTAHKYNFKLVIKMRLNACCV